MRFSIIVPVYNSAIYLSKTMDSICQQLHNDFEIICINDGSSDNSLEILELYQQKFPFIQIYSQKNAGPSAARNKGISLARGEYILFCDSDDWFERNTVLLELDTYIQQKTEVVDVIYFPGNTNYGGNIMPAAGFIEKQYRSGWKLLTDNCLCANGTSLFFGSIYAFAYRLEVIQKYSLKFNESVSYSEDRLWVFDFLDKAQCSIVYSSPCYYYNVRPNSLMTDSKFKKKKFYDELAVVEMMISRNWQHDRNYVVKKYLSRFYLACIKNLMSIDEYPSIHHKFELIYAVSSIRKFIGFILLCLSPIIYKKLTNDNSVVDSPISCT